MDLGSGEILLILLVALLLYGGRLPEVARSIGRSIATLKRSLQETSAGVTEGLNSAMDAPDLDASERPRTVRRMPPAPSALATEDISTPEACAAAPSEGPGAGAGGTGGAAASPDGPKA